MPCVFAACPRRVASRTCPAFPRWALCLFEYLCKQLTYICQAELYAALCAYVTFPDLLRGRLVHHFIDNKAAEAGLVKELRPGLRLLVSCLSIMCRSSGCSVNRGSVSSTPRITSRTCRLAEILLCSSRLVLCAGVWSSQRCGNSSSSERGLGV